MQDIDVQATSTEESQDSAFSIFINVYLAPKAAFQRLAQKPRWVLPLLFGLGLLVVSEISARQAIGPENLAAKQLEIVENFGNDLPEDERDEMLDRLINLQKYAPVSAIIAGGVFFGLLAGILFIAVMAMGGDVRFYTMFGTVVHAFGAYMVLTALLTIIVVFVSPAPEELDIQNLVTANPSFLLDRTESPVLFTLFNSLDLTSFYLMFLLALGISTVSRGVSMGMGVGIVGFFWVLWILIKMVPALIFS